MLDRSELSGAKAEVDAALKTYPADPLRCSTWRAPWRRKAVRRRQRRLTSRRRSACAPLVAAPYENLGRLYQEQSASDPSARAKALDVYQRLLAFDPQNAEGCYQSGFLLALDGRFAEARAMVERLPSDIRAQPQVLTLTATVLQGVGDTAAASAAATRWIASSTRSAPDVLALAPAFAHLSDHQLQQRFLDTLDQQHQAPPEALHQLGRLYIAAARYQEARAVLERAAQPTPGVPVLVDLARAADKAGDHEGALGYLAHARSLDPSDARVHFLFGVTRVELNLVSETRR